MRTIVIADTIFWHRMKSSSQIYVFLADTPSFLWENNKKLLLDSHMFLLDALLYLYV